MIINKEKNSIEFDNVLRAATNINDIEQTIKVNNFSFNNTNAKGDFIPVNSIEDLETLHEKGIKSAKQILNIISK
jgi:hypothetical protein